VFDEILVEWDRYILYFEVLCEKIYNAFPKCKNNGHLIHQCIKIYQWIDKPKEDKGKTPHHIKKLKVNDQPNL